MCNNLFIENENVMIDHGHEAGEATNKATNSRKKNLPNQGLFGITMVLLIFSWSLRTFEFVQF